MRIWDISEPIAPDTAVFPGDTPYSARWVMRVADGASANVATLTMSAHCGTHGDAPLHVVDGGADVASVPLDPYLGPCRVIEVRGAGEPPLVPAAALSDDALGGFARILLKTRGRHDPTAFDPGFTALGPAAARRIAAAGVRLVGIDTQSMDTAASKDLPAHHVLLEAGLAWLENLDLSGVAPGDYELIALPLKIVGADSSPVRAVLRELGGGPR